MSALPGYTVRVSPRAKHARLKLSLHGGLVVVVPKGFDQRRIPDLLKEKKRWLDRASEQVEEQRKLLDSAPVDKAPGRLALRAIGEEWAVDYQPTDGPYVAAVEHETLRLLVYCNTSDATARRTVLSRWLRRKAGQHLIPWLHEIAEERGFSFSRVLVKSQRTRWASYSQRGTVSLNLKLLFLPSALVRYVLTHELCHSVHANHSRDFWDLVQQHEPKARKNERELRAGWRYVPAWMDSEKMLPEL